MIISTQQKRILNIDLTSVTEYANIYKEVYNMSILKVLMNNEMSIERTIQESSTSSFSPLFC